MINSVVIIGRLTRDPELRTTTTGKQVVGFGIANEKRFKPQDGSPDANFFNVTAWGKTAEFVANYLAKGRLVAVEGRLEQRKYTDRDGNTKEIVEIVAENVQGLDRPRDEAGGGGAMRPTAAVHAGGAAVPDEDEFDPFALD